VDKFVIICYLNGVMWCKVEERYIKKTFTCVKKVGSGYVFRGIP